MDALILLYLEIFDYRWVQKFGRLRLQITLETASFSKHSMMHLYLFGGMGVGATHY